MPPCNFVSRTGIKCGRNGLRTYDGKGVYNGKYICYQHQTNLKKSKYSNVDNSESENVISDDNDNETKILRDVKYVQKNNDMEYVINEMTAIKKMIKTLQKQNKTVSAVSPPVVQLSDSESVKKDQTKMPVKPVEQQYDEDFLNIIMNK